MAFPSAEREGRGTKSTLRAMSLAQTAALPVAELAADNSALFLWAIDPMLPQALAVIEAWGFTFKTVDSLGPRPTPRAPAFSPASAIGRALTPSSACWRQEAGRNASLRTFAGSSSLPAANTHASRPRSAPGSSASSPAPTSSCSPANRLPAGARGAIRRQTRSHGGGLD